VFFLDGAGTNKQHVTTKNTAKLDRETEELRHDKIPLDVGKIIQQGRQNKGLSQKDLATVTSNPSLNIMLNYNIYCILQLVENLWETASGNWLWGRTRHSKQLDTR